MLLIWVYAIVKTPEPAQAGLRLGKQPALAEVMSD
jgi:hypothetical protein